LEKDRKIMIGSDLSGDEEHKALDRDMPFDFVNLRWMRLTKHCLTKTISRCGSIPGADFLTTLWRGGSL
jgi:hypothetical protein